MLENGTILQNRYLIEKQIGAGGMGAVYRAVDQRFDSFVAIKETFYKDDELGEAFEREAKLLNGLNHPNLPHVSDHFTEGGGHFLVMQFVEGEDLYEILKRDGAFPQTDVLRWTKSLLEALDYLHSQEPPVIHRDIKPQNLKITTRGDIVLLDFGLAKLNSDDTQAQLSVFGYSRKYSPLEQIQGTGTDARSDIFALGATIYHLLTGKPPIDVLARASSIIAGNPDPLEPANNINKEISDGIASVLKTALALNSAARFVSAKAMQHALDNAVNSDLPAKAEESLLEPSVGLPLEDSVVNSVETENFPALDAFAAEAASVGAQAENDELDSAEISIPYNPASPSVNAVSPQVTSFADEATKVSVKPYQKRFSVAALLLLLSCVGLVAGYFMIGAHPSNDLNQPAITESSPESNSNIEQSSGVSESVMPEITDTTLAEKAEQTKTAHVKSEPIADKRESVAKRDTDEDAPTSVEITDKPKSATGKLQPSRPVSRQKTPRNQPQQDDEVRSRVVETPVPDIESIFTGRPSAGNNESARGQNQRRQREQMSDEELREYRRQRREERRRRGNNFPF